MTHELTPIEESQMDVYRMVRHQSEERARNHICDLLCVVEKELATARWKLDSGHNAGLVPCDMQAIGKEAVGNVILSLIEEYPIQYRAIVSEENDSDEVINEEYVADDVRSYVRYLLQEWSQECKK